jgi:glycosyltransferase involved in cell wall biosynthesis
MKLPLVSLLIRTYRRRRYLRECLATVAAQSYARIEPVVVWNGSEPFDLGADEGQIKHVVTGRRLPLGAAMNAAIAAAQGEFLYVLDDDDQLLPSAIEASVGAAQEHKADLVFSDLILFDDWGETRVLRTKIQMFDECLRQKSIPHPSSLYRRSFLRKHGLAYDDSLPNAEDYDFLLALLRKRPRIAKTAQPVYQYRIHSGQQRGRPSEHKNALLVQEKWRPADVL